MAELLSISALNFYVQRTHLSWTNYQSKVQSENYGVYQKFDTEIEAWTDCACVHVKRPCFSFLVVYIYTRVTET